MRFFFFKFQDKWRPLGRTKYELSRSTEGVIRKCLSMEESLFGMEEDFRGLSGERRKKESQRNKSVG